jgi:hypothetical protein
MLEFSASISQIGVLEIWLKGQSFTWTNKQQQPLLEKLDWCFISQDWSILYTGTRAQTLTRDVSDHVLCVVQVKIGIPKPLVFCFENYWLLHEEFEEVFQNVWQRSIYQSDQSKKSWLNSRAQEKRSKNGKKTIEPQQNNIEQ